MYILAGIFMYFVGLLILYIVIETAVRKGINSSIIGDYIEKNYGIADVKKKSFFDNDLDDES